MRRILLSIVALLFLAGPTPAFAKGERLSAQAEYELAERYLKRGYTQKALEHFQKVRTYFRDDPYALKAELAIADMSWKKHEWDLARLAYDDFMRLHPRYPGLDYVVYRYGGTLFHKAPSVAARDQTRTRDAVNAWAGFDARFPNSEWKDELHEDLGTAKDRLARKELLIARFYARRGANASVAGRVEGLLTEFPDSPDRHEALYLGGVAWSGLGQLDRAAEALSTLRAEAPQSAWTKRLERELEDVTLPTASPKANGGPAAPGATTAASGT